MTSNNKTLRVLYSVINLLYLTVHSYQHTHGLIMTGIRIIALWGFNSASVESWTQENCVYEDVTLCLLSCQDSMCLHSCSHAVFCFGFVCCCCPPPSRVKPRWSVPSSHRCLYPIKHILKVTEGCAGLLEYSGRISFIIYAGRSILELSIYLKWSPSTNRPYL